jgi:hypothetical protein
MKGYVKNMTHLWSHTMKRQVGPGAKIPLDELYEQYGKRHNLKKGNEFINWLKEVKLRDANRWRIFNEDDKPFEEVSLGTKLKEEKEVTVQGSNVVKTDKSRGENVAPVVSTEMSIDEVVGLSVRAAREVIPKIMDIQLLKYAESTANQRTGKDSLRRILMKRIQELSISNRR